MPQPTFTVTMNAEDLARFFEQLSRLHQAEVKGSALKRTRVEYSLALVNRAVSVPADGTEFFYYKAVDQGRGVIRPKGGKRALVFAVPSGKVFATSAKASRPRNITARSLAEVAVRFPVELGTMFKNHLDTFGGGPRGADSLLRKAASAARLSSQDRATIAGSTAMRAFVALPDWGQLSALFHAATKRQVEIFKANTPDGDFDLITKGGQRTGRGKGLREGFELVAVGDVESFLAR